MKTRLGYVSNSSSSSFVIAYRTDSELNFEGCNASLTMNDFFDMLDRYSRGWADETRIEADGEENVFELESKYTDCHGEIDTGYSEKLAKFISDNRGEGTDFAVISISYHDKFIRKIYDAFHNSGKIVQFREAEE